MRFRSEPTAARRYERPDRSLIAIPLGLTVVIAVADTLTPTSIHLGPLLVVAPATTAAVAGARATAAIGALSVLLLVAIGARNSLLYTEELVVQVGALLLLSVCMVVVAGLRERRNAELSRVRAVSEATQRVLLRPLPPRVGPLAIASHYRAAEADAQIGGDLYALARTRGGTRLIIGDVSGRGLASINDTAMLLGAFRAAAHRESPLPELIGYLEGSVRWGLAEPSRDGPAPDEDGPAYPGERFVTAVVLDIPDDEQVIRMVNCGHPPPMLLRAGGAFPLTTSEPAPPLGLGSLLEVRYEVATHRFADGDLLLLYTDGLSEARDRQGDFYPLAARIAGWPAAGTHGLLDRILSDVRSFTAAPLDDDLAMVAVERVTAARRTPDTAGAAAGNLPAGHPVGGGERRRGGGPADGGPPRP